jgi:ABC-type nitrate/sulfonate/bicarbonate transport system substrate-binding protein
MIEFECGVKAFDPQELLCHYAAKRLGFYAEEGLDVVVRDRTFTPDAELPRTSYFQVACGAAFLGRRQGAPFKVLIAACERPMFWLHGGPEIERIEDLAGKRVGTYAPVAPPHWFHRLVLQSHGLDPDTDLSFEPMRDDAARLGMLAAGEVQAAAVSSAISPIAVQRRGLKTLALFGDTVTFVTAGVATFERIVEEQPGEIAAIVRSFRRALDAIHDEPDRVMPVLADLLGEPEEVARATYEFALTCFTRDGRVPLARLQAAVDAVERVLPDDRHVDAGDLYDFSLVF